MLTLLHTDLNEYKISIKQYAHTFPPTFQQKIQALRRPQDQQAAILGRLLLKKEMETQMKEPINWKNLHYNKFGKPYWKDSKVEFNIAHAQELVVCVFQKEHPIGIDIEKVRPIEIEDFRNQMTEKEWYRVQSAKDQERAFFEYWTQKEAVIKANGKGLSLGLKTWELDDNLSSVILENETWYVQAVEMHPDYCCHIATTQLITEKINLIEVEF